MSNRTFHLTWEAAWLKNLRAAEEKEQKRMRREAALLFWISIGTSAIVGLLARATL